jgi:hypothetical protein
MGHNYHPKDLGPHHYENGVPIPHEGAVDAPVQHPIIDENTVSSFDLTLDGASVSGKARKAVEAATGRDMLALINLVESGELASYTGIGAKTVEKLRLAL